MLFMSWKKERVRWECSANQVEEGERGVTFAMLAVQLY